MEPSTEDLEWLEGYARRYAVVLAIVFGLDWNNELTPWPAPGLRSGEEDFEGRADTFLQTLLDDVVPSVEEGHNKPIGMRSLIGVSLSGLFALWAGCHTDAFSMIASLSGSLWYDGFTDWLLRQTPLFSRAFLLLGDKEKKARNPRMAVVEEQTCLTNNILREKGVDCVFTLHPGTHFAPFLPRLEKALNHLLEVPSPIDTLPRIGQQVS